MYDQSLPPTEDSPTIAAVWARGIAMHEQLPDLAERAAIVARDLVAVAVRRTPLDQLVHAQIDATEHGLAITVRDPGQPDPIGGREWAEMSSISTTIRTRGGPDGHEACVELRTAVPA